MQPVHFCFFLDNLIICLFGFLNCSKFQVKKIFDPKAWEEMQEEGLEANAVGESQSSVGNLGDLPIFHNGFVMPGDLWLYVGCLCEMWSP